MEYNKSRLGYTFCIFTLYLCGALLFLIGFFPASYTIVDESGIDTGRPTTLRGVKLNPPSMSYDAVLLFLIDALRIDFPNSTTMPVAYEQACEKITLHVDIPTVTMPRLKSITTGTLSNFIDIALNIGHTEPLDDSILHRLKKRNMLVSFVGDDTWLRLFPSELTRHIGNNATFFVHDFDKGDKIVTRALERELKNTDWSFLILHYLGLDHIGHVEGNKSPKVREKLKEMDEALRKILENKNPRNSMVLLTGDHGMADGGGHGGNSPEEIAVPLYLYTRNCTKSSETSKRYNQIDLAPTLAILFSIEIPKMSIGCLIPEMLQSLTLEQQLYAYFYNAHHLLDKATQKLGRANVEERDFYSWYENATLIHKQLLLSIRSGASASNVHYQNAKLNYLRVAREISGLLSESLVKFDYGFIAIGLSITIATSMHIWLTILFLDVTKQFELGKFNVLQYSLSLIASVFIDLLGHQFGFVTTSSKLNAVILLIPISASIYLSYDIVMTLANLILPPMYSRRMKISLPLPFPLLFIFALRTFTLGSSSFIEYEYKTWYFLGTTLLLFITFQTLQQEVIRKNTDLVRQHLYKLVSACVWQQKKIIVVLILLTLMRYLYRLNSIKTAMMIWSLFLLWARLSKLNSLSQNIVTAVAFLLVYSFRGLIGHVIFIELPGSGHVGTTLILFWCCVAAVLILGYRKAFLQNCDTVTPVQPTNILLQILQTNLTCLFLVAALLQKPQNVILLPTLLITLNETYKLCYTYCKSNHKYSERLILVYKIVMTIFVARMFHYYQGNSNSLATIDLTPGYIGQSSYNPIVVGIFVTLNTFCSEIHSFLYLIVHTLHVDIKSASIIQNQHSKLMAANNLVIPVYAALIMLPSTFYLCLMVGFRYHLFIYSVFSPKVLYDCYTSFVFYLILLITSVYFKIFSTITRE